MVQTNKTREREKELPNYQQNRLVVTANAVFNNSVFRPIIGQQLRFACQCVEGRVLLRSFCCLYQSSLASFLLLPVSIESCFVPFAACINRVLLCSFCCLYQLSLASFQLLPVSIESSFVPAAACINRVLLRSSFCLYQSSLASFLLLSVSIESCFVPFAACINRVLLRSFCCLYQSSLASFQLLRRDETEKKKTEKKRRKKVKKYTTEIPVLCVLQLRVTRC